MKTCSLFVATMVLFASIEPGTTGQPPNPEQPAIQEPVIPPAPPDAQPGPLPTPGTSATGAEAETNVTITVSKTIVNPPGAITIIGTAASEQEKQDIAAKLQQAAPGRTINNQLTVSSQGIFEPAGAERGKEKSTDTRTDDSDDSDEKPQHEESEGLDDTDSK